MTLVELLVVMGVIALIVGISMPSLMSYSKTVRLKTTVREVVGFISLARSQAISAHAEHAVVIDQAGGKIRVVNQTTGEPLEQAVKVPAGLTVALQIGGQPSQETQFVFRTSGSLLGRTVSLILADHDKQHTITVTASTGSVSVTE